jgi:hypothetical protein
LPARSTPALALRRFQTPGCPSEQDTASVVKVDILETLLHQLHGGPIPGADVPTAVAMIEDSDNDDATALGNQDDGAPAVAAYDRLVGMDQTTPNVAWGLTTTSVGDQLKPFGELLETHALIDQGAQRFALGLMENVTPSQAWGVSGGVPSGVSVALKNGWLPFGGRLAHHRHRADPGRRPVVSDRRADELQPERALRDRHDQRDLVVARARAARPPTGPRPDGPRQADRRRRASRDPHASAAEALHARHLLS